MIPKCEVGRKDRRYITAKECLAAVKKNGLDIMYMDKQIPKVCLAAVRQNGYAIVHIKNPTYELCLEAIKKDPGAIRYVIKPDMQLCLLAVEADGMLLALIESKGIHDDEIRKAAIRQNCLALTCIEEQTAELSLFAYNISQETIEGFIKPEFKQFCIDNCDANKRFRQTKRAN